MDVTEAILAEDIALTSKAITKAQKQYRTDAHARRNNNGDYGGL